MLSPALLHNLCPRGGQEIVIRMSPYGMRNPGVPTAKSIELAVVASPFSIHRHYEPLLTDALREHFGSSNRLVKGGDIIPLRINVDRSLDSRLALRPGDVTGSVMQGCSYVAVYFVIRNVDYESVTVRAHGQPLPNLHVGCFVDSNVTKVVQVGVEHARVPDIYDYYELGLAYFGHFTSSRVNMHSQVMRGQDCQWLWESLPRCLSCRMPCRLMNQQAWVCGLQFLSQDQGELASSQRQFALPVIFRCIVSRLAVSYYLGL